jgi:hypothetical protein
MSHTVSGRALRVLLVTAAVGLGASAPALADEVTIHGSSDVTAQGIWSYISGDGGSPTSDVFASNDNNGNEYRTLLKFDIAGNLPPGATIDDAHLILNTGNSSDNGTMSTVVYAEFTPWTSSATWDTPDGTGIWNGGRLGSGGTSVYGQPADAVDGVVDYEVGSEVEALWTSEDGGFLFYNPNYSGDYTTESFVGIGETDEPKLVIDYDTN